VVSDIEQSRERYSALLGPDARVGDIQQAQGRKEVDIWLGGSVTVPPQPAGDGELHEHLETRGERPNLLVLSAKPDIRPEVSDPNLTHGVSLTIASSPLKVSSV